MVIKSPQELEILRSGGRRLAAIRDRAAATVSPGLTTSELNRLIHEWSSEAGDTPAFLNYTPAGAPRAYPAASCISINDVVVHGIPDEPNLTIKEGDMVMIDIGLIHQGLVTDTAITVIAGEGDSRAKTLIAATEEALARAIDLVRPGRSIQEVSTAIENVAKKYGFGVPLELGGHGVGKHLHEDPHIPNVGHIGHGTFKEGLVVAIEPIFTEGSDEVIFEDDGYTVRTADGLRSAETEHTIVVTKDGAEILTSSQ